MARGDGDSDKVRRSLDEESERGTTRIKEPKEGKELREEHRDEGTTESRTLSESPEKQLKINGKSSDRLGEKSQEKSNERKASLEKSERSKDNAEKLEKNERLEKTDRPERLEKTEKAEKVEKAERERSERPEKFERIEKADRPEKTERIEKERPERLERAEKSEKPEKTLDKQLDSRFPTHERTPLTNLFANTARLDDDDDDEDPWSAPVPSIPPPPVTGPWRSYKEKVAQLSSHIIDAQRPIRVLHAIQWDSGIWENFKKSRFRDPPTVGPDSYARIDLGFEPKNKIAELEDIAREIDRELDANDDIAGILRDTVLQYRDVVRMLEARGTPAFYAYSRKLYGSPKDKYPDGRTTVRDSAHRLYGLLSSFRDELGVSSTRDIPSERAAAILSDRLKSYFADSAIRVEEDENIFADAAAGSDYVKVRRGALFSMRDIDLLEVHEGWVHLATSINGQNQPVARWLSKGPPRTTAAQEGLAALLEIITFKTYPRRARRLNDRVIAVDKAEDGADFCQVFEWFRTEGYDEEECFYATRRVFRGGVTSGGAPFTKDIAYSKGIVLNYAFIRACFEHDAHELIPLLFVGKIAHEDLPILARRVSDGVVRLPKYLPPVFRDLNGLAIWMSYSTFFTQLAGAEVSAYYAKLFGKSRIQF